MSDRNIFPANKIRHIKPYFYVGRNQKIKDLSSEGMDIIRLDIGAPDLPPPENIVNVLMENVKKDSTHSYTPIGGGDEFRGAIANYYKKRFNVEIDPQR